MKTKFKYQNYIIGQLLFYKIFIEKKPLGEDSVSVFPEITIFQNGSTGPRRTASADSKLFFPQPAQKVDIITWFLFWPGHHRELRLSQKRQFLDRPKNKNAPSTAVEKFGIGSCSIRFLRRCPILLEFVLIHTSLFFL